MEGQRKEDERILELLLALNEKFKAEQVSEPIQKGLLRVFFESLPESGQEIIRGIEQINDYSSEKWNLFDSSTTAFLIKTVRCIPMQNEVVATQREKSLSFILENVCLPLVLKHEDVKLSVLDKQACKFIVYYVTHFPQSASSKFTAFDFSKPLESNQISLSPLLFILTDLIPNFDKEQTIRENIFSFSITQLFKHHSRSVSEARANVHVYTLITNKLLPALFQMLYQKTNSQTGKKEKTSTLHLTPNTLNTVPVHWVQSLWNTMISLLKPEEYSSIGDGFGPTIISIDVAFRFLNLLIHERFIHEIDLFGQKKGVGICDLARIGLVNPLISIKKQSIYIVKTLLEMKSLPRDLKSKYLPWTSEQWEVFFVIYETLVEYKPHLFNVVWNQISSLCKNNQDTEANAWLLVLFTYGLLHPNVYVQKTVFETLLKSAVEYTDFMDFLSSRSHFINNILLPKTEVIAPNETICHKSEKANETEALLGKFLALHLRFLQKNSDSQLYVQFTTTLFTDVLHRLQINDVTLLLESLLSNQVYLALYNDQQIYAIRSVLTNVPAFQSSTRFNYLSELISQFIFEYTRRANDNIQFSNAVLENVLMVFPANLVYKRCNAIKAWITQNVTGNSSDFIKHIYTVINAAVDRLDERSGIEEEWNISKAQSLFRVLAFCEDLNQNEKLFSKEEIVKRVLKSAPSSVAHILQMGLLTEYRFYFALNSDLSKLLGFKLEHHVENFFDQIFKHLLNVLNDFKTQPNTKQASWPIIIKLLEVFSFKEYQFYINKYRPLLFDVWKSALQVMSTSNLDSQYFNLLLEFWIQVFKSSAVSINDLNLEDQQNLSNLFRIIYSNTPTNASRLSPTLRWEAVSLIVSRIETPQDTLKQIMIDSVDTLEIIGKNDFISVLNSLETILNNIQTTVPTSANNAHSSLEWIKKITSRIWQNSEWRASFESNRLMTSVVYHPHLFQILLSNNDKSNSSSNSEGVLFLKHLLKKGLEAAAMSPRLALLFSAQMCKVITIIQESSLNFTSEFSQICLLPFGVPGVNKEESSELLSSFYEKLNQVSSTGPFLFNCFLIATENNNIIPILREKIFHHLLNLNFSKEYSEKEFSKRSAIHQQKISLWRFLCTLSPFLDSRSSDFSTLAKTSYSTLKLKNHDNIRFFIQIFLTNITLSSPNVFIPQYLIPLLKDFNMEYQFATSLIIISSFVLIHLDVSTTNFEALFSELFKCVLPWMNHYFHAVRIIAQTLVYKVVNAHKDSNHSFISAFMNNEFLKCSMLFLEQSKMVGTMMRKQKFIIENSDPKNLSNVEQIYQLSETNVEHLNLFQNVKRTIRDLQTSLSIPVDPSDQHHQQNNNTIESENDDETVFQKRSRYDTSVLEKLDVNKLENTNSSTGRANKRARHPMIVVGSLLENTPNIAGLARTCEIFNVGELWIANIKLLTDANFQKVSMAAEKQLPVVQVVEKHLSEMLKEKKKEGYQIVGVEQTPGSVMLNEAVWNEMKVVLVVGNEKRGVPPDLLQFVDYCVEIPQLGLLGSLNAHVCASIVLWEYTKTAISKS